MTHDEQRRKVTWLLLAGGLVLMALILHNTRAHAQTNCLLVNRSFPEIQMSFVSKRCWEVAEAPIVIPRMKPVIQTAPIAKHKAKIVKKRNSACGSKRQVWRTLKGGHRKYRCR